MKERVQRLACVMFLVLDQFFIYDFLRCFLRYNSFIPKDDHTLGFLMYYGRSGHWRRRHWSPGYLASSPDDHDPELNGEAHAKFHRLERLFLVKSDEHALDDNADVEDVEDWKENMRLYFKNE